MSSSLNACNGQEQTQTGALPKIDSAPYKLPTQAQAKAAYIKGYKLRYDIPALEYPKEIKDRVRAARIQKLKKNKKLLKLNMAFVKKSLNSELIAKMRGEDKTISDQLMKHLKSDDLDAILDLGAHHERMFDLVTLFAAHEKQKVPLTAEDYDKHVKNYTQRMQMFKIENCRWKPMKKIIGAGYEEMASLYGERPSSGYDCVLEAHLEKNSRNLRAYDATGYFIKSAAGEWLYFGNYMGVGVRPHRLTLNPKILKNPEKAVKTLPYWEIDV